MEFPLTKGHAWRSFPLMNQAFVRALASLLATASSGQSFAAMAVLPKPTSGVLTPAKPWRVDYGDQECRLLRTFGTGDAAVTLRLARGGSLTSFDFVIAGKTIPKLGPRVTVKIKLVPQAGISPSSQAGVATFDGYSLQVPKSSARFIRWFDGDDQILGQFTARQRVEISAGKDYSVSLDITGARAALDALSTCYDDLLQSWGIDVKALRTAKLLPRPAGNPGSWATTSDYPREASSMRQAGTSRFMIVVGVDGRVSNCRVFRSSGFPVLDERTCQVISERARFKPAMDMAGKPISAPWTGSIRWDLPGQ